MACMNLQVQNCPLGCDSKINDLNKLNDNLDRLYNDCYIKVQAYQNAVKTLESQRAWYQNNQLAYEEKIRVLQRDLENTSNELKYSEKINAEIKMEKQDLQAKLDNSLSRFNKWKESSKNLAKLIDNSLSVKSKLGLGYKDYTGPNEIYYPEMQSIFDPEEACNFVIKTQAADYDISNGFEDLNLLVTTTSKRRIIVVTKALNCRIGTDTTFGFGTSFIMRDIQAIYIQDGDLKNGFAFRYQRHSDSSFKQVRKNLNVEDRLAFGVFLRMFTRNIVIQRRVKDLQLGVESYQKKLNITKPDTYRSDIKRKDAYIAYSIPRGFIYLNKDKKNKLMRIDELHKFSDGTLDDVRTALIDRLKWIRMEYLPKTIWRQSDRERAKAMIQAIEKMLKSRRIMRSLERFVGRRPYGGDLRLLQRTI
ncbi:hypothetical protein Tco_1289240 [Tanacetum coccineum]